ncbi:MAG: hypothetical protein V2G33_02235 [bacterium JZ-2024 1]
MVQNMDKDGGKGEVSAPATSSFSVFPASLFSDNAGDRACSFHPRTGLQFFFLSQGEVSAKADEE